MGTIFSYFWLMLNSLTESQYLKSSLSFCPESRIFCGSSGLFAKNSNLHPKSNGAYMTFSTSIIEPLNISVVFVDLLGKIYGIIKWSAYGHSLFGAAVCTIYDKVGISYHVWWPVRAWAKSVNKCHTWRWFYSFDELSVIFGCWYYYVVIGVRDFNCIYRKGSNNMQMIHTCIYL